MSQSPVIQGIRFCPSWNRKCKPGTRWELSYTHHWGHNAIEFFDSFEDVQAAAAQMATDEDEAIRFLDSQHLEDGIR